MTSQPSNLDLPRYLDGVTSQSRDVRIALMEALLVIEGAGIESVKWPYTRVFVKDDWINPTGAILGCKDHPDASLTIRDEQQFQKIQQRLPRRHQASFIIPIHYRSLSVLAIGAVAAGFLLFPLINQLANLTTYLVPKNVEKHLGQMVVNQMSIEFKPCTDKAAVASLQKISARLSAATGEKNIDPQIYLFQSETPNAFSVPGEKIAVLSGFLNDAKSENEIAAVMAHEMGHMVKRDSLEMLIESQGLKVIANLIGSSGSYGGIAEFGTFMQSMNYSRKKEFLADEYGAKLLVKAGYSPEGLSSFLSRMDKAQQSGLISKTLGQSAEYLEFLSTHPDTKERVKRIGTYAKTSAINYKSSLTQAEFLKLKNACR